MRYHTLGDVPPKRHAQTRRDGKLLVGELLGYEGFSGNESILYHLNSPCRLDDVGAFTPIVRDEWVPDTHVHRLPHPRPIHARGLPNTRPIAAGGDPISSRKLLMFNNDIEAWVAKPDAPQAGFYRNGEG